MTTISNTEWNKMARNALSELLTEEHADWEQQARNLVDSLLSWDIEEETPAPDTHSRYMEAIAHVLKCTGEMSAPTWKVASITPGYNPQILLEMERAGLIYLDEHSDTSHLTMAQLASCASDSRGVLWSISPRTTSNIIHRHSIPTREYSRHLLP